MTSTASRKRPPATKLLPLDEAIGELISDGDSVAFEGFTHLIPFAAGQEAIRQGKKDLELIRMTPDLIFDQMIGAGCARRLIFSYGGNPGVGSLHRLRDAVENAWPAPLELEEHSHAGMVNRYVAGASGLPFAVLRGYTGTDLPAHSLVGEVTCPFTGEVLSAVPALKPDLAVIHAQQADRSGNVQLWGIPGVQKEAVFASRRSLVTVEEVVEDLTPQPGGVIIPHWQISAISHVPGGASPSYAHGYTTRDNDFYREWDEISRSRTGFKEWLDRLMDGPEVAR